MTDGRRSPVGSPKMSKHTKATSVTKSSPTFRSQTTEHWLAAFRDRKLPIGAARHADMMFEDEQVKANGFLATVEHETLGGVTMVAPPVQFSGTPLVARPSVSLGKHSRAVLREAGLSGEDIDRLFEAGKVREVHESREDVT